MLSKDLYYRHIKTRACLGKGKTLTTQWRLDDHGEKNLLKTLWEKEKMVVTFERHISCFQLTQFTKQPACNFRPQIYPCSNKPWFLIVSSTSLFENTVGKREIDCSEKFVSHSVFYLFGQLTPICIKFEIVIQNSFSLEESVKFVI